MIAVDVETCDPELKSRGSGAHRGSFVAGVAVGTEAGYREYFPVAHEAGGNVDKAPVVAWLKEQMQIDVPKVGANLLYDVGFLEEEGIKLKGPLYDVQVAEPLLDENKFAYNLESLSQEYLGVGKVDEELDDYLISQFGDKKNPKSNIWRAHPDKVRSYAIGDVNHPLEIFAKQKPKLEAENLWKLFILESKLIPMLAAMRRRGVAVDIKKAEQMRDECGSRRTALVDEIKRQTGVTVAESGMGSEIVKVLEHIGISEFPLTPETKKPSLTAAFIESIGHPVTEMVIEVRQMGKLIGTFLEGSVLNAHHKDRVHCQFNQLRGDGFGAVSGRFSSSKPNLQFIPVRTELGKKIRSMFLPDSGQSWYKLDYSQIEYVLMIHDAVTMKLPGAAAIAEQYRSDESADFHQMVADMAGLTRTRAKTINFGLAYGEGIDKLCRQLGLTREEGEALIKEYHRGAPFMRPLIQGCMGMAAQTGEIRTLLNRKRRFNMWELWKRGSKDKVYLRHRVPGAKRAFTYAALNARTQGSAADVMKAAMVDAWESGVFDVLGVAQLTVHDELDGSYPETAAGREAVAELKRIMESVVSLSIPLRVDAEFGPNWGETQ